MSTQQDLVSFDLEQVNKAIQSISKLQAKATKEIGNVILMALYFANKNKDAGVATALVNCLRTSTKQAGIIALLEEFGNLAYTKIGKKAGFEYFDAHQEWNPDCVKELRDICQTWETYKPAKEETALDVAKAVESLIKRADSAKKNNKEVVGAALLEGMSKLLAKYHAAKIDAMLGA